MSEEQSIGTSDLRQRLTDVLQAVREQRETYLVETFGRPQAALISMIDYEQLLRMRRERESFFEWLDGTAVANAGRNRALSETEVLDIIEQARSETAPE